MIESNAAVLFDIGRLPLVTEEELIETGGSIPIWRRWFAVSGFSANHRLNFYRALSVYRAQDVREGAALVNWWNVLTARGSRSLWHPLATLIPIMLHGMHNRGARWQTLFKQWVPADDAMIITASERAGLTPQLLQTLLSVSLSRRQWVKKVRAAAFPALFHLVWLSALLAAIGLYYFPALQHAMPHMRLVGRVATLAHLADFIQSRGWVLLLLLLALPVTLIRLLRGFTGPIRSALDGLPGFSLYRQASGMTFLLGLSALLDVGENFSDAVRLLQSSASPYVRERLDAILAFDDLRPAEAMAATGYHWPDDATLELLGLYMVTKSPQDGIRLLVEDWFDHAGDVYGRLAVTINSLGQILTWGIVGWLYLVTTDLTATITR
jgi:hypothetical protein